MTDVYRVRTNWRFEIVKIAADKVTESSVFINGSRASKVSDGVRYFEDFDSAVEYAAEHLKRQVDRSRDEIEKALGHLQELRSVTKDTIKTSDTRW